MAISLSPLCESARLIPIETNMRPNPLARLIEAHSIMGEVKDTKECLKTFTKYLSHENQHLENIDMGKFFRRTKDLTDEVQNTPIHSIIGYIEDNPEERLSLLHFFAVIDLLSNEQALKVLDANSGSYKKWVLLILNRNLSDFYLRFHDWVFAFPIDNHIIQLAAKSLQRHPKYRKEDLETLPFWEQLDKERSKTSLTLSKQDFLDAWKKTNRQYLTRTKINNFSLQLIREINDSLRSVENGKFVSGYRKTGIELLLSKYSPGYTINAEMEKLISWLNTELLKCDNHQANPILLAAAFHQRFVTIHPFVDANGRTGRLIADMILRRHDLLPAVWKDRDVVVAIIPNPNSPHESPTIDTTYGASKMLQALQRSYQISTMTFSRQTMKYTSRGLKLEI
jgi:fido (protein-threonine AMPylation protein)